MERAAALLLSARTMLADHALQGPGSATTAVCIVGAPRSFSYASRSIRESISASKVDVDYFFVLRWSSHAQRNSKDEKPATNRNPSWVKIRPFIQAFSPVVVLNSTTEFREDKNCPVPQQAWDQQDQSGQAAIERSWETMVGFKECFMAVEDHEANRHAMYHAVVRLRTDTFFYGPMTSNLLLPAEATFPRGRIGCSLSGDPLFCVNDHLAFLPRAVASRYFDMADRYRFCGVRLASFQDEHDYWRTIHKGKWLLSRAIVVEFNRSGVVPWRRELVPYSILRREKLIQSCDRAAIREEFLPKMTDEDECMRCLEVLTKHFLKVTVTPLALQEICSFNSTLWLASNIKRINALRFHDMSENSNRQTSELIQYFAKRRWIAPNSVFSKRISRRIMADIKSSHGVGHGQPTALQDGRPSTSLYAREGPKQEGGPRKSSAQKKPSRSRAASSRVERPKWFEELFGRVTDTIGSAANRVTHPATPPAEARRLNLLMCPHTATEKALRAFGVRQSALPPTATVHVCQHRAAPHAGILYVHNFLTPHELHRLRDGWPSEEELFGPHCNEDRGELTSFMLLNRHNASHPLVQLDSRISKFTSLAIGKYAHKRYDNSGSGELLNNLHHDANGACCGMAKKSLARVATLLLYTSTEDLAGGHTVFPTLTDDADSPQHAASITPTMWETLSDTYYKAPYREHFPDQLGAYMNSTLGGLTGEACARLVDADARGLLSGTFGVRPVPGDAVLFFMKVPNEPNKADRQAFHAGCPLVRGSKDAIQKFLQRGGSNDISDLRRAEASGGRWAVCNKG